MVKTGICWFEGPVERRPQAIHMKGRTMMYGPILPSGWPRSGSQELRRYAVDEWHADHLFLISEVEKQAAEERLKNKTKKREGKMSSLLNFLMSIRNRDNDLVNRK